MGVAQPVVLALILAASATAPGAARAQKPSHILRRATIGPNVASESLGHVPLRGKDPRFASLGIRAGPLGRSWRRRMDERPRDASVAVRLRGPPDREEMFREEARNLSRKMIRTGWEWPEGGLGDDFERIRQEMNLTTMDAVLLGYGSITMLRVAFYGAGVMAAVQTMMKNNGLNGVAGALAAGYFLFQFYRQVNMLGDSFALKEEVDKSEDPEALVQEALNQISALAYERERQMLVNMMMEEVGKEGLEISPEELKDTIEKAVDKVALREKRRREGLDSLTDEDDDDDIDPQIAYQVSQQRAEEAIQYFANELVVQVRELAAMQQPGSALGTLSSLDMLVKPSNPEEMLTHESLGVSEELFNAADNLFRRFDSGAEGFLDIKDFEDLVRTYRLPLLEKRDIRFFANTLAGLHPDTLRDYLERAEFLRFWAAREKAIPQDAKTLPPPPVLGLEDNEALDKAVTKAEVAAFVEANLEMDDYYDSYYDDDDDYVEDDGNYYEDYYEDDEDDDDDGGGKKMPIPKPEWKLGTAGAGAQ